MFKLSSPLALVLAFQLAVGPFAFSENTSKVSLEKHVDNLNDYVESSAAHCFNSKGEFMPEAAFTNKEEASKEFPKFTNCGQAAVALSKVATETEKLVQTDGAQCADCAKLNDPTEKKSLDLSTGKENLQACSLDQQKVVSSENCTMGCALKAAIKSATFGASALLPMMDLNSCPASLKSKTAVSQLTKSASCFFDIAKGMVEQFGGMMNGLYTVAKAVIEIPAKIISKGWNWLCSKFKKTEDVSSDAAQMAAKHTAAENEQHKQSAWKWIKSKVETAGSVLTALLKEMFYVGGYERESACLDCMARSKLMCKVIGRAGFDMAALSVGMGAVSGLAKSKWMTTAVAALKDAMPAISKENKIVQIISKGSNSLLKVSSQITKPVVQSWKKLAANPSYIKMMEYAKKPVAFVREASETKLSDIKSPLQAIKVVPIKSAATVFKTFNKSQELMFDVGEYAVSGTKSFKAFRLAKAAENAKGIEAIKKADEAEKIITGEAKTLNVSVDEKDADHIMNEIEANIKSSKGNVIRDGDEITYKDSGCYQDGIKIDKAR